MRLQSSCTTMFSNSYTIIHPVKAKHTQCLAFTQEHRRCRLEAKEGKTCSIHRNYYTNWLKGREYMATTQRKKVEFEFQVKNKHVILTESFCRQIQEYNFYEYCITISSMNPLWNTVLVDSIFYSIVNQLQYSPLSWEEQQQRLNILLATPEVCKYIFKKIVELIKVWMTQPSIEGTDYCEKSSRLLLVLAFQLPTSSWRQMLGSTFFLEECAKEQNEISKMSKSPRKESLVKLLEEIIIPAVTLFIEDVKKHQKNSMDALKEELMMEMWKPERIQSWYDKGGWELQTMMIGC